MNSIDEKLELSESEKSDLKNMKGETDEEDLGRSGEDIDLNSIEVTSKVSIDKKQKPILS